MGAPKMTSQLATTAAPQEEIFTRPVCRVLDESKKRTQAGLFAVGTAKVDIQQEGIPSRKFITALFGGGTRFVPAEVELGEVGNLSHRISFPAHSTISIEGEPSTA